MPCCGMFIVGFAISAGPLIWGTVLRNQPLKGRDFGITCSTATNWIANMIVWRNVPDHAQHAG
ncbi:MFS transporter [Escherichia coli]